MHREIEFPEPVVGGQDEAFQPIQAFHNKMSGIMKRVFLSVTDQESESYTFIWGIATAISINMLTGSIPEFKSFTDCRDVLIRVLVLVFLLFFIVSIFWFSRLFLKIRNDANVFLSKNSWALREQQFNREKKAQLYKGFYEHRKGLLLSYLFSWIFGILSLTSIIFDSLTKYGD
jgi:hypothetical protein